MTHAQLIALISAIWAGAWLQVAHRERCSRPLGNTKRLEDAATGISIGLALSALVWSAV